MKRKKNYREMPVHVVTLGMLCQLGGIRPWQFRYSIKPLFKEYEIKTKGCICYPFHKQSEILQKIKEVFIEK